MTGFNLTTTGYENLNPMMMQNYVTVDACKDYVASTTRTNYILMGCILVLGIAILLWINKDKIFKKVVEKKSDNFISNFQDNFKTLMEESEKDENFDALKYAKEVKNGRGNISENNDSGSSDNLHNDIHTVLDDETSDK